MAVTRPGNIASTSIAEMATSDVEVAKTTAHNPDEREQDRAPERDETERRRQDRSRLSDQMATVRTRHDVRVLNLNQEGMGVESRSWLAVGSQYRMRLTTEGLPLAVKTRVLWCSFMRPDLPGANPAAPYRAGLALDFPPGQEGSRLRAQLALLIEQKGEARLEVAYA